MIFKQPHPTSSSILVLVTLIFAFIGPPGKVEGNLSPSLLFILFLYSIGIPLPLGIGATIGLWKRKIWGWRLTLIFWGYIALGSFAAILFVPLFIIVRIFQYIPDIEFFLPELQRVLEYMFEPNFIIKYIYPLAMLPLSIFIVVYLIKTKNRYS